MIRYASCVWELPMPTPFRAYQPDQPLLLPPDLQEWVPPGHLAHHVSDVVDALDLTAFYAPYEGDGRRNAPDEPSMMVKVLIYAYATGTFSSRAVARKLEEDVAFRMLAASNFPQHRTVCEFRRRHLAEFSELFVGVVQVAREMGLARFGKLSVDGTKVRANASKRKAMSYGRMGKEAARLQAEIEALLTKAGMVDAEEDERWGEDFRGDELPEELQRREKRLAAIQAAKARLEAAQRGRDDERFLSNLPEAAGGAKRMREMGWRDSRVLGLWFGAALLLTAAAVAGNLLFRHAPEEDLALIRAFAGGAVIASLATEIFPKAYRRDHHMAGVATALGFLAALLAVGDQRDSSSPVRREGSWACGSGSRRSCGWCGNRPRSCPRYARERRRQIGREGQGQGRGRGRTPGND